MAEGTFLLTLIIMMPAILRIERRDRKTQRFFRRKKINKYRGHHNNQRQKKQSRVQKKMLNLSVSLRSIFKFRWNHPYTTIESKSVSTTNPQKAHSLKSH